MTLFMRSGSITDPEKRYHLEFVCGSQEEADEALRDISVFGIPAGTVIRKGRPVVYLKDSESISDMLAVLGAHNALLRFENVRIMKEMRGAIQRRVNFETANISKTVLASLKQVEDIELIRDRAGLQSLPEPLREIAAYRLQHPEATLLEIANEFPDVGRSGINHRFRRIARIAEELRKTE